MEKETVESYGKMSSICDAKRDTVECHGERGSNMLW